MILLLADENLPKPVVDSLRQFGHDSKTMNDLGFAGRAIPDTEVLELAHSESRCVITFNRKDFIRLHQQGLPHSGIIVCTFDTDYNALAQRIHQAILANEPVGGQLIRVQRPNG